MPSKEEHLSSLQLAVIRRGKRLAKTIVDKYPDLIERYQNGITLNQFIVEFGEDDIFHDVHESVVRVGFYQALVQLLGKEEVHEIAHENKSKNAKRVQLTITHERRLELGRTGGNLSFKSGLGIHSQTHEEHIKIGKKGGEASAIVRGMRLWSDEEKKLIATLAEDQNFQHQSGPQKGRIDYNLLQEELEKNGFKRSRISLRHFFSRSRKGNEK